MSRFKDFTTLASLFSGQQLKDIAGRQPIYPHIAAHTIPG